MSKQQDSNQLQADEEYIPCSLNLENVYGKDRDTITTPVKLAIIGAGAMGAEHAETAYSTGGGEVVGLFDPNPGSINFTLQYVPQEVRDNVKQYRSLQEAAADPEVEALIIATPNYTHADVVREVLPYQKHILLEKPMAHTYAAARDIYDMTRDYEPVFYVGFEYRDKPLYREAIYEALQRRSLGEVKMIHIMEHRCAFLEKWRQWNKFSRLSGGTLIEKCCHYFDLFNIFAESTPVRVYGSGDMFVNFKHFEYEGEKSDILDGAFVIIDYDNGVRANLNLCMFAPGGGEELRINGNQASLYGSDRPVHRLTVVSNDEEMDRKIDITAKPKIAATGHHDGSTYYEHRNFYRAVRSGKKAGVGITDGLWTVAIGDGAEKAINTKNPVDLPELPPRQ